MKRNIAIVIVLTTLVAVFAVLTLFQTDFSKVEGAVSSYIIENEVIGVVVFIFFAAFSAVLSPLSSIPAVPFAVLAWGETLTFIFLIVGWIIGALISYAVGKYGLHVLFRRILPLKKMEIYQKKFSEHSEFILVVLFRLALPSEVTGLVLGSLRYNFTKYLAATIISEIPFALVVVYSSGALIFSDFLGLFLWIAIGVTCFFATAAIFRKKIHESSN